MFIELGYGKANYFKRNIYIDKNKYSKELEKIKKISDNTDVYNSIYLYSEISEESLLYAPFYLDFDYDIQSEEDFNKIKSDLSIIVTYLNMYLNIPKEYINIYFSGSKGFHLIISPIVFNIIPCKNLNIKYKLFAEYLNNYTINKTIDTKIYDRKRLFRVNNTINSKTGLYKIQIDYSKMQNLSFKDIKNKARNKQKEILVKSNIINKAASYFKKVIFKKEDINKTIKVAKKYNIDYTNTEMLPCIRRALEIGSSKGNRNNTCIALSSALFQMGKKQEEVIDIILLWNELNEPPLPQREVLNTVKSANTMHSADKNFGCPTFLDMDMCSDNCKLYERR